MNFVISSCLYRRPQYTERMVRALQQCPEFHALPLVIALDRVEGLVGGAMQEQQAGVLRRLGVYGQCSVLALPQHTGCNGTTYAALRAAYETGADFIIHIEEDIVVSPDALRYLMWVAEKYRDDKAVFSATLWRHDDGWLPECGRDMRENESWEVAKMNFFQVWGWGMWRDRLQDVLGDPSLGGDMHRSWDIHLTEGARKGRAEIRPCISRSQNIGEEMGTHRGAATLPYVAGILEERPYVEI